MVLAEDIEILIKWAFEVGQTEDLEILLAQCPKEYLRDYLVEGE